ncbi:MAG: hypothetical protein JSR86_15230 [Proteobacteria bacterium]|nr:hypothetical protein [Pseudomonadota bacterium]
MVVLCAALAGGQALAEPVRRSHPSERAVRPSSLSAAQLLRLWEGKQNSGGEDVRALARLFPNEMLGIAQGALDLERGGAGEDEIRRYVTQARIDLKRANLRLLLLAPDAKIKSYIDKQAQEFDRLAATNVAACAARAKGGGRSSAAASSTVLALMEVDLMAAGRATPVTHPDPTTADFAALQEAAHARGLTDADLGAVFAADADQRPMAELCREGVALAHALSDLPTESAVRIETGIMSGSSGRPVVRQTPEQRITALWKNDILGQALLRLGALQPEDTREIIDAMVEREKAGDLAGLPGAFEGALSAIVRRNMDTIAAAPDDRLAAVAVAAEQVLRITNSADPHCGLDQPPVEPAPSQERNIAVLTLKRTVVEALIAGLEAKAAGNGAPPRSVSKSDTQLLRQRLQSLSGDDFAAAQGLLKGTAKSLPWADRCRSHVVFLSTINSLQPAARSDFVADYIRGLYPPAS